MVFALNTEIPIVELAKVYQQTGCVTIPNFLSLESAENVSNYLNNCPEDKWSVSIHPFIPNQYIFNNTSDNRDLIDKGLKSATEAFTRGEFSYFFYRQDHHGDECSLCQCIDFLNTQPVFDLINAITNETVSSTISVFGSSYRAGSFLTTHTDTGRGKIAHVLNLTKDWRPQFGGCLTFLDWDFKTINRIVNPTFNSLTIFNVKGSGVPHMVLPVHPEIETQRLAISGWFQ